MHDPITILETDIEVAKASFGVALADAELRGTKQLPLAVAQAIGLTPTLALIAARSWISDPITVDARVQHLADNIPPVPTKEQIAMLALSIANNAGEDKDRVAALKLIAEMFEYIPKAQTNIDVRTQVNNNQVRNIMLVPELEDDWEAEMLKQQREAIADAGA